VCVWVTRLCEGKRKGSEREGKEGEREMEWGGGGGSGVLARHGSMVTVGDEVGEEDESRRILPRVFGPELRQMMYGFGDVAKPLPATIELVEEMLIEYLTALVTKSVEIANARRREKPNVSDVKFVIRKDRRRMQRVRYLLDMKAEIERVTNIKTTDFADPSEIPGMEDDPAAQKKS